MNPLPALLIILCTLTFEGMLIGDEIAATIAPYQIHIDTTKEDCSALAIGCAFMNLVRPILAGLSVIINGVIFIAALATFSIPGAPWWARMLLSVPLNFTLIWSVITLFRGTR